MSGKDSFISLVLLFCFVGADVTYKDIFWRVQSNSVNLTRNVDDFYFYPLPRRPDVFTIPYGGGNMYEGGNYVYHSKYQLSRYNARYWGYNYTFETIAEVPFTAMYLFGKNLRPRHFSIKVTSNLGVQGRGKFETFKGSVSLRNYTLQYGGAQVYSSILNPTVCEVYYFLPLAPNSRNVFNVATPYLDLKRMENNASVQLEGGQAVMGYTLLSKFAGIRVSSEEIKATMLTMMHVILGGSPEYVFWRVRNNAANLTRNIKNFNSYTISKDPSIRTGGGSMYIRGNYVDFKVGNKRYFQRAAYNKSYTGRSYTFATHSIVPFTAMFLLGENSGPESYSIKVSSNLGVRGRGKFETFNGSVSLRNYTLQYGGAQVYSSVMNPTVCEVYYYLPIAPNFNRTFNVTTSHYKLMVMRNTASIQFGGGQAVLGYILLSKPSGLSISKNEIRETMLTMLRLILHGNQTEIFERLQISTRNLTRNIANFYHYRLRAPPGVYAIERSSNMYYYGDGNHVYFKAGSASRRLAAYNKTYTGPSYTFVTFSIHPFTAMYFLDANSGQENYSIEVLSALETRGSGVLQIFEDSVSLRNYRLTYRGAQVYFDRTAQTVCEVYFYLPLTSNSNRDFSLVIADKTRKNFKNNATVHSGRGEAVFGYTLLSKHKGAEIGKEEIKATMLTMLHVILGVDQSVWSPWTAWAPNTTNCGENATQSRTRSCTSGLCLQTSNTVNRQKRPCRIPAWVAGIFERVRTNIPDLSRKVEKYNSYTISTAPRATSIQYFRTIERGNYVYFRAGQEPLRLVTYNKTYMGPSYFFETFAIHPFTAMFVLNGNSDNKIYTIEVQSQLYTHGRGKFKTSRGSVSLRNYTLLFEVAEVYLTGSSPVCEVYYLMPLTSVSKPAQNEIVGNYNYTLSRCGLNI